MQQFSTINFQRLFDNLNDAVIIHDQEGKIIYANKKTEDILGITFEEVKFKQTLHDWWLMIRQDGSVFPDDEHPSVITLKTGEPVEDVVVGLKKPYRSEIKWLKIKSLPVEDDNTGQVVQAMVIVKDITDLKDQEYSLHKTRHALKGIKEAIYKSTIISVTDLKGRIIEMNDRFCEITGYSREELVGRDHSIINSGFHSHTFFRNMWDTILAGKSWHGDIKNKRKDGSFYWIETTINPVVNQEGRIDQFISIRHLVTKRVINEIKLRESNHFLHLAEEIAQTGSYKYDLVSDALEFSPQFLRMFGLSKDFQGTFQDLAEYVLYDDLPIFYKLVKYQKNFYKYPTEVEFRVIKNTNEEPYWVSHTSRIMPDNPNVFLGTIKDITNKKIYIEELKSQNERLSLVTETAGIGFWEYNTQSKELFWDEFMYSIFGVSNNIKPSFDLVTSLIVPEKKKEVEDHFNDLISKEHHCTFKYRVNLKQDGTKWLQTSAKSFTDEDEDVIKVIGVTRDITSFEEQNRKLNQAEKIASLGSYEFFHATETYEYSPSFGHLLELENEKKITLSTFLNEIIHSEDRHFFNTYVSDRLANQEEEFELSYKIVTRKSETVKWIIHRGRIFYDEDGKPIKSSGIVQDISTQRANTEKLVAAISEKEELIKEIHHRVKNNLQMISSILNLRLLSADDPALRNFIEETDKRIRSISLLHERLLMNIGYKSLNAQSYFKDLVHEIITSFNIGNQNVNCDLDIDDLEFPTDVTSILGLITTEILVNSMKHAFTKDQCGTISLSLKRKDNHIIYVAADNGKGIDLENIRSNSFGLNLVDIFVRQLNGNLSRKNDNGLKYIINFSINDK